MLVLLSSGARPRYREDIIRCLALQPGGQLQFRYDLAIVDEALVGEASSGGLAGQSAMVCYVSNRAEGAPTDFVPCRMVRIVRAEVVGSSFIVLFEVGGYPKIAENIQLQTLIPDDVQNLPRWEREGAAFNLRGLFAFELKSKVAFDTSSEIREFEAIVTRLTRFADFAGKNPCHFFAVLGIQLVKLDFEGQETYQKLTPSRHGAYNLKSGDDYELWIYVFAPDRGPTAEIPETAIHIQSENKLIEFPLTKSREIDSEYDLKRFRFSTEKTLWQVAAALIVFTHSKHSVDEGSCDIAIPVIFKRRWVVGAVRTGLIAFGSSVPAMIAAAASSKLDMGIGLLMFGAAVATGIGTVFFASRKA